VINIDARRNTVRKIEYLAQKEEEALIEKMENLDQKEEKALKKPGPEGGRSTDRKNGIPGPEEGRSTVRKMEYLGQNEPSRFSAGPQVEVGQLHNRHDKFFCKKRLLDNSVAL
jgi:hypothetical protein